VRIPALDHISNRIRASHSIEKVILYHIGHHVKHTQNFRLTQAILFLHSSHEDLLTRRPVLRVGDLREVLGIERVLKSEPRVADA
jgi:hypothetical protein